MKHYFITGILIFFCTFPVIAQSSVEEKELIALNEAFDKAILAGDLAFYESLLAPEYISYNEATVKNRKEFLEEVTSQKNSPTYLLKDLKSENVKVKVSGNLAVITANWKATTSSLDETDKLHNDQGVYYAVFEKRDGRWLLLSDMGVEKPHTPEEMEPDLKKASEDHMRAYKTKDIKFFKKLLADDYSYTDSEGNVSDKEQEIRTLTSKDLEFTTAETRDKTFKIFRDTAVETGEYTVAGNYKGEAFSHKGRYTATWVHRNGRWQIVADHTSELKP